MTPLRRGTASRLGIRKPEPSGMVMLSRDDSKWVMENWGEASRFMGFMDGPVYIVSPEMLTKRER